MWVNIGKYVETLGNAGNFYGEPATPDVAALRARQIGRKVLSLIHIKLKDKIVLVHKYKKLKIK